MKKAGLTWVLFIIVVYSFAQEKPPEVTNDSSFLMAGDTVTVNVLLNDWCMEGHSMKLFFVSQGNAGTTSFTDSTITYVSYYYFGGIESIPYRVVDLDNNLISEDGYLILTVNNQGNDYLDINNVSALINAYGMQFWKLYGDPDFEVPKGNNTHTIFNFNLWMGGLDENNELHFAGELYRMNGMDYYFGPVAGFYENQQMISWNKVWKFNREELEYHRQNWWKPDYEPIENIISWPAHGDVQSGQNYLLAPFNDYDEDGNYDPYSGDVPAIRGDQGVFMIYNDDMNVHSESGGQKTGVEIQVTAYAYDCPQDSVFNNSVFFHYDIINRSDTAYHDFYLGAYVDFDLGNAWDDFTGCDTLLQSFYGYNGDDYDENNTIWNPDTTFGYLNYPPAQAVVFLNIEMNSFLNYEGFSGLTSHPNNAPEYYNNLKGLWKDGTPVSFGGNGLGGDTTCKYMYPGNPSNPDEWSEVSAGNTPNDRNGTAASGPYYFNPGDTIRLDMAFLFARDYQGDNLSSVALLKERVTQLRWYFENDSTPCGHTWSGNKTHHAQEQPVKIYPNPASESLFVQLSGSDIDNSYKIYNLIGKVVQEGAIGNQKVKIHVEHLKRGYYIIKISNPNKVVAKKFMKY